ncbi:hypothetical protein Tco_0717650 [Tanacetum coccineum]
MSSSSSSSQGFCHRVNNKLCTCKLPVRVLISWTLDNPSRRFLRPGRKNSKTWIWFDPELEQDWYRYQLFDMYNLLNPHERHQHQAEMMCEERFKT